jgi:hypothetical protein
MSRLLGFAVVAVALVVFSGAGCKKNSAPEPPQVQGPGVAKPGATLTFGFTSADPDGDDVWYMISWGDGTPTEWSSGRPSGGQFVQTHVYPDSGAYFIKAKAKDSNQAESGWSDSIQVAVGYFAPNTPLRPAGPTVCTTGVTYIYMAKAIHPLGDNVAYQFYWGDSLGDWGFMVPSGEFFQVTHVFDTLGTYMIAVRARDARGLETAWSDSLKVVVGPAQGGGGRAPGNLALAAATDSTVSVTWSVPADTVPSRYVVSFQETGASVFDSVGGTQSLSFVHDPAGRTGQYQVTAVYDSARYASAETPGTTPIANSALRIPELNGGGNAGYGWNRTTGEVTMYDMTIPDSASRVDLYVTDFAQGFAGPVYSAASPFLAPSDPGGGVPPGNWHITEFTHLDSLATENDPLPRYFQSRYENSSVIDSFPMLIACHTEDGYFALMKTTGIDTINGTADVQTWFQLVPNLRLIRH